MIRPAANERSLTGAEVEHFYQYGFVRLKKIIAAEHLEKLREGFDFALDTLELSPSACDMTLLAEQGMGETRPPAPFCAVAADGLADRAVRPYLGQEMPEPKARGHFRFDTGVWRRVQSVREFALYSEAPQLAAAFLGAGGVRFYDDQMVVKEAGALERTAFHQDLSYLHVGGDCGLVLSVFLDRARHGAGAIGFVPGSHRWGQLFKANYLISDAACPGSEGADLPGIEAAPNSFGVQYIDVEPGDMLLHHVLTLTGQQGNRGKTACRVLSFVYVDAALKHRRRPGISLPPLHNHATRDGAEMDPNVHPLVWPRLKKEALAV